MAWLTPDQLRDWRSLIGLLMTLPTALDGQLKCDAGINVFEYHILAALSETEGRRLPMGALARTSQGSLSRLSHAVSRLERAGWVRRVAAEGRRIDAELTEAGWTKLEATAPGHVREARRLVVDVLTPDQLASLGESARAIVAVADPELSRGLGGEVPLGPDC